MGGKWNRWVTPISDKIDGKKVVRKEYNQWAGMINRAKGQKYYEDVQLSELFKSYDLWCGWAKEQKGFLNTEYNGKIWSIDKDILGDGTIYSEDVCVFVPTEINNLVKGSGKTNLPTGVISDGGNKSNPFTAKLNYLGVSFNGGVYDSVERAHKVYLRFRKEMVKDIMEIYGDSVDERVYAKLLETCEPEYYGYS